MDYNPRLKKNILDSALEKGTQLYDVHRCNIFWNNFPNINGINDYYFDYDLRYYIIAQMYMGLVDSPSKREINLILQYSKNKTILDLGAGARDSFLNFSRTIEKFFPYGYKR